MLIDNLKQIMAEKGVTQRQLAELLGRDNAVITNLFKGNRRLTVEEAQKIADFLGVSLNRLVTGKEDADPFTIDPAFYRRCVAIAENYLADDASKPRPTFEEFSWMVLRCYHLGMAEKKKRGDVSDVQLAMRFVKEWEREQEG